MYTPGRPFIVMQARIGGRKRSVRCENHARGLEFQSRCPLRHLAWRLASANQSSDDIGKTRGPLVFPNCLRQLFVPLCHRTMSGARLASVAWLAADFASEARRLK